APEHPLAEAGAQGLGARLLGGEALGVGGGAASAAVGLPPLDVGEHAGEKAVAIALDGPLHAPDVDDVVAQAEDHHVPLTSDSVSLCRSTPRTWSIFTRMRRTLSARPIKSASPTRKCPIFSSTISGISTSGLTLS